MKVKKYIQDRIKEITYNNSISLAAARCNELTFLKLKNCNANKEVVLCGAGPTLSEYRPIENAVHVALNRALLFNKVKYDWFIADDWDGIDFMQDTIIKYDCKKMLGTTGIYLYEKIQIPESFYRLSKAEKYYTDIFITKNGFESKFICDIDKMPIGGMPNIALQAMQILLFSNPERIFLVGCDASNAGHFVTPDNLNQQRINVHNDDIKVCVSSDLVIKKWLELKKFINIYYPDIEVVSINPVGLKGIFKDVYR